MRILRIRRGFTTNSSGANEYLSKSKGRDRGPSSPLKVAPTPAPTPPSPHGSDARAAMEQPPAPSSASSSWGGPQIFALLGLGVVLLFLVDRLLRLLFRKRRHEDGPPPEQGT